MLHRLAAKLIIAGGDHRPAGYPVLRQAMERHGIRLAQMGKAAQRIGPDAGRRGGTVELLDGG
jgi:UDP-N-acetylmuramoylalanine-D-glutamate ligase